MQPKVVVAFTGTIAILLSGVLPALSAQQSKPRREFSKPSTRVTSPAGMEADSHFERVLSNDRVRVFRLTIAPNEATKTASHPHDYLIISMGKNEIEAVGGPSTLPLVMNDGEVQIVTGGWPHKLVNKTAQPASLITVEIPGGIAPTKSICGLGTRSCTQVRFGKTAEGSYTETPLFETEKIRVLRAELGPGGVLPSHTDEKDHLILPTTAAQFTDGMGVQLEESPGGAIWNPERLRTLRNTGKQDASMLIVELK